MSETDWEWRQQQDLSGFEYVDPAEAWVLHVLGQPVYAAVRHTPDTADDHGSPWTVYAILTAEDDGFAGFEGLDGARSLDEAQAVAERDRDEIIRITRENLEFEASLADDED